MTQAEIVDLLQSILIFALWVNEIWKINRYGNPR